ncbi:hypothetical protein AG1IA_10322 [Rhizoctonia solani AG-1 IA]|uniref:Uncharacterized protein n=1 Tax=Thanatephorus cucumeris (strain AG1-IA) TaxID=983506 RepID=L8WFT5_THACA|nr:hypothetical protein AG1IA_10322 [Rhizoctonia solani AG-1 IA]
MHKCDLDHHRSNRWTLITHLGDLTWPASRARIRIWNTAGSFSRLRQNDIIVLQSYVPELVPSPEHILGDAGTGSSGMTIDLWHFFISHAHGVYAFGGTQ